LITLKGLRLVREADVIVHDRLIPAKLLAEARAEARVVDVGKAPRRPCLGQGRINALLVEAARSHGHVVRLKGGDPALFGRLGEEIEEVRAAGIPFEVVPGVTSATAAAARAGVSLTGRGAASMVVFATGTERGGDLPRLDWDLLARVDGTLVFYMVIGVLDTIATMLTAFGREPRDPALVVQAVGTAAERVIAGRLGKIAGRARAVEVQSPAILVTGPTVDTASIPLAARGPFAAPA
jgi:uroporphyrin-III C-methyltransferase